MSDGYNNRDRRRDNLSNAMLRKLCQDRCANSKKPDKRPPELRKWIDKAVRLYIHHHDIERKSAFSLSAACRHFWKDAKDSFKDRKQYENLVRYDLGCFYDIEAEVAKIKSGTVTVP